MTVVNTHRDKMKLTILAVLAVTLSGCASTQFKTQHYGYRPGDPCIKRGEKFQRIPNFENEATIACFRAQAGK